MGRRGKRGTKRAKGAKGAKGANNKQGFLARHEKALALWIGVVALVVAVLSLLLSNRAVEIQGNADLEIVALEVTTKRADVRVNNPVAGDSTEGMDVATTTLTLKNVGESAALITKLQAGISRVWTPRNCDGAGAVSTSATYDFVLPGDIEARLPHTQEKKIKFEVEGQRTDQMAVTVGFEALGEVDWATSTLIACLSDGSDRSGAANYRNVHLDSRFHEEQGQCAPS